MTRWLRLALVSFALAGAVVPSDAWAEPVIDLRLGTARFPNGASIIVPATLSDPINVWLDDALAIVEVSTIRVLLNGTPMSAFMSVNRLPRGVRVIVRMGLSFGADFTLRKDAENVLTFSASDETKVTYNATFYLRPDEAATVPRLATLQRAARGDVTTAPRVALKPVVKLTTEVPGQTTAAVLEIGVEAGDGDGLRRVVIEVNGREEDGVLLQNERPVRQRRGWISAGGEPGSIGGDSRKVTLLVPVPLRRNAINVIVVKAENVHGLIERIDRTVQTSK